MIGLHELLQDTNGRAVGLAPETRLFSATADSRMVAPGDLFCAVRGSQQNGHDYAADALHRGALAALVDEPTDVTPRIEVPDVRLALWDILKGQRRRFNGKVVAVTGSVGKTTTKEVMKAALSAAGPTFATAGNFNSDVGLPMAVFGMEPHQKFAVLEMGMRTPGEIHQLAKAARPDVAVVTTVSVSHVGILGSVESVARAKAEILGALPPEGAAVLNADDPWTDLLRLYAPASVVTVGAGPRADVRVEVVEDRGLDGWRLHLYGPGKRTPVVADVPWPGRGARVAAGQAAAVALVLGVDLETAARGLSQLPKGHGRIHVRQASGVLIIDDTYNAAPDSMEAGLELLQECECSRRLAVLGDMKELGAHSRDAHLRVGRKAAGVVDLLFTVGEEAKALAEGALEAGLDRSQVFSFFSAQEVLPALKSEMRSGDGILVKGSRAMMLEQVVQGVVGE